MNCMLKLIKTYELAEKKYHDFISSITKAQRWAFFSTLLCGLVAHIPAIANDLLNHDSVGALNADANQWLAGQGKWAASYLISFLRGVLSVPSWFVLLGIIFFSLSAVLIVRMFYVKSPICAALIGCILVANDSVVSMTLAYGTDYFGFCIFLTVLAVYITRMYRFGYLLGIPLLVLCIGGYQPMIGIATSLFVLLCIVDALDSRVPFKRIFLTGIQYIIVLLISGGVYYCILRFLVAKGIIILSTYKNIGSLTSEGFSNLSRVLFFFKDSLQYTYKMMFGRFAVPYRIFNKLNILFGVSTVITFTISVIRNKTYRSPLNLITAFVLLFVIFPFSANLVDFLTQDEVVSRIMRYAIMLIYCVPLILCDNCIFRFVDRECPLEKNATQGVRYFVSTVCLAVCFITSLLVFNWCSLAHDAYGYVKIANNQMMAKCAVIMASVYDCEGYDYETPVVLIGSSPFPYFDDSGSATSWHSVTTIKNGTQGIYSASNTLYRTQLVERVLNARMGAGFAFVNSTDFYEEYTEQCDSMPIFPLDGSVTMVDGTIVVKLNDVKIK